MPVPSYPTILTAEDWNKKKGIVAKLIAVPTKLGDELREAKKDYDEVNWNAVFAPPGKTVKEIGDQIFQIEKGGFKGEYGVLKDTLQDVKEFATKVREEWKKNKLIPGDSKKHLDNIITTCDTFWNQVNNQVQTAYKALQELYKKTAAEHPEQLPKTGKIVPKAPPKPPATKPGVKKPGESETRESESHE